MRVQVLSGVHGKLVLAVQPIETGVRAIIQEAAQLQGLYGRGRRCHVPVPDSYSLTSADRVVGKNGGRIDQPKAGSRLGINRS